MKSEADNLNNVAPKESAYPEFEKAPVAYFCAEYALDSSLPTYAGGLGVLAGDIVMEVARQGFPLIPVGLFYKKAQSILSLTETKTTLATVTDQEQKEIIVSVLIEGRVVSARAWLWLKDQVRVYLLDTDIPENIPEDREITKNLYDESRDLRLKQEIVLGVAGFRLLARLGYHAGVYHLNEGHSAFLALELVRHEMEHQGASFTEACEFAKKHVIFTNHTLVLAGQEQFAKEKVVAFMEAYAKEMGITGEDIAKLGITETDPSIFSMTTLSFNLSTKANAVSKLHQEKAKMIWPSHPMECVTNGIFVPRWDKIGGGTPLDLWSEHLKNKKKLLALVTEKTDEVWGENDLIFVWARRLVEYKQPLLFLEQTDKLLEVVKNSPVPVRIIFSGPTSEQENPLHKKIEEIITEKLKGIAVFLPHYSVEIAEVLVAGADIWLNTPLPGTEACGTSGMKAGLNGVLALSTNDGWVHEVDAAQIGWVVNEPKAEVIFGIIEKEIIPLYFTHLKSSKNSLWLEKMGKARNFILENFGTSRTLREYIEKMYIPTLEQKHKHLVQ